MAKHQCIQRVARGTERALSVIADAIKTIGEFECCWALATETGQRRSLWQK